MAEAIEAADIVVARILGGPQDLCEGFRRIRRTGKPMVVLGGEQTPHAALMELSTVAPGVVAEAHRYLAEGGAANLRELHAFLGDTLLMTGEGFEPPVTLPTWGVLERPGAPAVRRRPPPSARRDPLLPGPVRRREHRLRPRPRRRRRRGRRCRRAGPRLVAARRPRRPARAPHGIRRARHDGARRGRHEAGHGERRRGRRGVGRAGPGRARRPDHPGTVPDVEPRPVGRERRRDEPARRRDAGRRARVRRPHHRRGRSPSRRPTPTGCRTTCPTPSAARRLATLAVNHARLRHTPPAERRIAIVLSAYPSKHSRIGNAVGLDTPVSIIRLLRAMRDAGYDLGEPGEIPGTGPLEPVDGETPDTTAGNALIHALIEAGGQDEDWLTQEQLSGQPVRIPAARYREHFDALPAELRDAVTRHWGEAPGEVFVDRHTGPRRRARRGEHPRRQRRHPRPAAARLRREPDRDLPRPRPAADAPLPRRLRLARKGVRRARRRPHGQARQPRVAARARTSRSPPPAVPTRRSARSRSSTPSSSTTPARAARPSAAPTRRSSTTSCRRWPAPSPTATSPDSSSCSTSTATSPSWTRPRRRPCAPRSGRSSSPLRCTTTWGSRTVPTTTPSTSSSCTSTAGSARSRTSRSATASTSLARPPRGRASPTSCSRSCGPTRSSPVPSAPCRGCGRRSG